MNGHTLDVRGKPQVQEVPEEERGFGSAAYNDLIMEDLLRAGIIHTDKGYVDTNKTQQPATFKHPGGPTNTWAPRQEPKFNHQKLRQMAIAARLLKDLPTASQNEVFQQMFNLKPEGDPILQRQMAMEQFKAPERQAARNLQATNTQSLIQQRDFNQAMRQQMFEAQQEKNSNRDLQLARLLWNVAQNSQDATERERASQLFQQLLPSMFNQVTQGGVATEGTGAPPPTDQVPWYDRVNQTAGPIINGQQAQGGSNQPSQSTNPTQRPREGSLKSIPGGTYRVLD